jgi:serine protease Do
MNRVTLSALCISVLGVAGASFVSAQEAPHAHAASNRRIYVQSTARSYLGIGVAEIDAERAKALGLKEVRGAEVKSVDPDSPAAKAGLKEGDVVLEYNGQRIEGTEQFVRLVRETPVDRQVRLVVWRNGGTQTLTATIGRRPGMLMRGGDGEDFTVEIPEMPPMPPMPEVAPFPGGIPGLMGSPRNGLLGIESESLGPQLANYFGVKEGVLVRAVIGNSPAERAGLRAGDVIVKIDGETVTTTREIVGMLRAHLRTKSTFPITIVRDKKEMTLSVTLDSSMRGRRPVALAGRFC